MNSPKSPEPAKSMLEDTQRIKQKEAFERAKVAEMKRKKMQGDLMPREEVINILEHLKAMNADGKDIDFDTVIENAKTYTLQ